MKTVDTQTYISTLRELTEEGHEVSLRVAGASMVPFLGDGRDDVYFKKPDRPLRVGDIVFFQRTDGRFILHRICKIKSDGYYIVGDNQIEIEGPVKEEQIFAVVTKVKRKGKWIGPDDLLWKFFEHVWLKMIPFRRILINGYSKIRRIGR